MFAKSWFYWNQWVSAGWSDCRNKTTHTWDVWDFLLPLYVFRNLRFLVGGFSQASCPQTRTIFLADMKQPWLFLRRTALRRGLTAREMNPFYSCHGGSDASTNLQFLSHLSLEGESSPRQSLLHHWGQQDQQLKQCLMFVGEGRLSCRSWPCWSSILGHPMFSLSFPSHRKRIPFHAASLHTPGPSCDTGSFICLAVLCFPSSDLFFGRRALLRSSVLCQNWTVPLQPSREELSLHKVCREGSSCSGASGLSKWVTHLFFSGEQFYLVFILCSPPASVWESKKFF